MSVNTSSSSRSSSNDSRDSRYKAVIVANAITREDPHTGTREHVQHFSDTKYSLL
jgi:hypothetical protein